MRSWLPLLVVVPASFAGLFWLNSLARIHYQDCVAGSCVILDVAPPHISKWLPEEQIDAVVATVIGEVRGVDSPEEVAAVTDVIWNRYELGAWGKTLKDVVHYSVGERHAFSCWDKTDPSYRIVSDKGTAKDPKFKRIRWIVELHMQYRLQRKPIQLTHGATHYFHPASMKPVGSAPSWSRTYKHTVDIGGARFYRATWVD